MGFNLTTFLGLKKPTVGTPPTEWPGYINEDLDTMDSEINNRHKKSEDILPNTDNTRSIGSAIKRLLEGYFVNLTLGGVSRNSWPTAVAGSNGNVFQAGAITLNGQTGVTVTHNKGDTSYLVKALPTGTTAIGKVGDIAYVKSANTVVVYNSGQANLMADVELSAVA